ncbi:hypothetical protein [Streptomyces sp. NPDC021356]|uniref:hypothetical protein n=1 Tax=Streptomyces sp. NPDC021356 TaxID=3154900 RepID=UPI00340D8AAD
MIQQLAHQKNGNPDATARADIPESRAPQTVPCLAVPHLMGLRLPATRPHRHKVPLRRLTALAA